VVYFTEPLSYSTDVTTDPLRMMWLSGRGKDVRPEGHRLEDLAHGPWMSQIQPLGGRDHITRQAIFTSLVVLSYVAMSSIRRPTSRAHSSLANSPYIRKVGA